MVYNDIVRFQTSASDIEFALGVSVPGVAQGEASLG